MWWHTNCPSCSFAVASRWLTSCSAGSSLSTGSRLACTSSLWVLTPPSRLHTPCPWWHCGTETCTRIMPSRSSGRGSCSPPCAPRQLITGTPSLWMCSHPRTGCRCSLQVSTLPKFRVCRWRCSLRALTRTRLKFWTLSKSRCSPLVLARLRQHNPRHPRRIAPASRRGSAPRAPRRCRHPWRAPVWRRPALWVLVAMAARGRRRSVRWQRLVLGATAEAAAGGRRRTARWWRPPSAQSPPPLPRWRPMPCQGPFRQRRRRPRHRRDCS
mmetsp:Transcript_70106/g.193945  ORF Transcript_70106/g.193945 Transcript_70106/m.193945 type:complete len:269 (-) Transcript_70106:688-1494(-)